MAVARREDVCPSLTEFPAFPPVARRLMAMLSSGEAELPALVALIETDPVFAVEILRFANSAVFGSSGRIRTLHQAIAQVGVTQLRSLIVGVGLRAVTKSTSAEPVVRQCLTHSLACALIAKRFCSHAGVEANEAYTLGLLHDIGRLGLMAAYPDEYGRLLQHTYRSQRELLAAEEFLLGVNHCTAGGWLADEWNLSSGQRLASVGHHDVPKDASSETVLIAVSCGLAQCHGFGVSAIESSTIEDVLAIAGPELAQSIVIYLPELHVSLSKQMKALRLM